MSPQELKALLADGCGRPRPLTESERTIIIAAFERMDQVAAMIGASWQDEMSAVEAVKEQRRDL